MHVLKEALMIEQLSLLFEEDLVLVGVRTRAIIGICFNATTVGSA